MSIEPRLPPDLERKVFELAAHEDSRTAFRIILVAHRCRSWIEPILYRSVVVCQSSWSFPLFLRTLDAQPTHYAQWIKEIQIDPYVLPNDPAVPRVLSICTSVVHLIDLSHGRTPFSVLSQLRLTRLCISLDIIDGLAEGAYFGHPAFAQLTHLHVLDAPQRWPDIPFSDLPALTHLALQNYKDQIRSTNVPVLKKILTECRNLQVLVVFTMFSRPDDCNTQNTKLLVDDSRLTILPRTSARRDDIWDFAKESTDNTVMAIETRSNNIWATKPTRRSRRKRTSNRREVSIV